MIYPKKTSRIREYVHMFYLLLYLRIFVKMHADNTTRYKSLSYLQKSIQTQ